MKWKSKLIINSYTNINKTNSQLSPYLTEQKQKSWNMTLDIQILDWDRGKTGRGGVKPVNGNPIPPLDNWIQNGNTYINKG
jgi:hypothetical protein